MREIEGEINLYQIGFQDTFAAPFDFKKSYSAFLGMTSIFDRLFLVLVDEVQQVCVLDNCGIFTITSVSFVPVQQDDEFFSSEKGKELIGLIVNLRKVFIGIILQLILTLATYTRILFLIYL